MYSSCVCSDWGSRGLLAHYFVQDCVLSVLLDRRTGLTVGCDGLLTIGYSYSIEERYPLMRWTNQTGSRVMGIDVKRIARERSVLSAADPCRRKRSRCRWHFSARDALPLIRRSKPKRPRTTAGSKHKVEVPSRVGVDKPTLLRMMVPFSLSINRLRLLSRGSSYAGVCVIDMLGGPRCRRGGAGGSLVVFYLRLS